MAPKTITTTRSGRIQPFSFLLSAIFLLVAAAMTVQPVSSIVFESTGSEVDFGFVLDDDYKDDDGDEKFSSRGGSSSKKRCRTIGKQVRKQEIQLEVKGLGLVRRNITVIK